MSDKKDRDSEKGGVREMDGKEVNLAKLTTSIEVKNLDEVMEKLEKIKSLMCEINDLSKQIFK